MGFDAGDMPLQCSLKELLAFFTVVASSQISPHTQSALFVCFAYILCKGNLFFAYIVQQVPFFFSFFLFFNKKGVPGYCVRSSLSITSALFPNIGCGVSGAISTNGARTKSRRCMSG